ncbi:50S ribosomal protein L3 [Candidatus Uhrbacteria bacterium]|nr:50S ribosomal protein L3 [Candidatus Uhrbacteria bacterium]
MKYIIGRKIEMKQEYGDNGMVVPYTLVKAGPCIVTQVKTVKNDGYDAIQFGFGEKKKAHKPLQGHLRGLTAKPGRGFACIKEMRLHHPVEGVMRGDVVNVASFAVGDHVDVTGTSKGKGFAGVVKRHHFHGHPTTHGHKDQERMPGSIGSGGVQHVFKGKRMAGRMGGEQVTVKKLTIVSADPEQNILAVYGAIPGPRNGIVVITSHEGEMVFEKNNQESEIKNQGEGAIYSNENGEKEDLSPQEQSKPVQEEGVAEQPELQEEQSEITAGKEAPSEEAPAEEPLEPKT